MSAIKQKEIPRTTRLKIFVSGFTLAAVAAAAALAVSNLFGQGPPVDDSRGDVDHPALGSKGGRRAAGTDGERCYSLESVKGKSRFGTEG